ncbi:hypothetical protein [Sphingomonas astaxanthinifaciens]|uniref:Lipoprotein n=1 Tax=Sphingomonas astaxanthinifaciens DSM 22298 TaxID=1123267 RepID=A0ABQ5Z4L0_9SPHN|nr:hypothetical protein [Sphingomonas astaxanthinifaciens]GLR46894.1 hypothetical protein GCM10007925_06050 [Sphingomonas astaxanthinifaciens DSM 22298]
MKGVLALLALLSLGACDDLEQVIASFRTPSNEEIAQGCGVTVDQFQKAKAEALRKKPYDGVDFGRCSALKNEAGSGVTIISMQLPPEAKK